MEPRGHRRAVEDIGPPICPSVSEETGRTIGSPFQKTTVTDSFPTGEGKICRRELRLPDEFEGWEELQKGEGGGNEERGGACGIAAGFEGGRKKLPTPRVPASSFLPRGAGGQRERLSFLVTY